MQVALAALAFLDVRLNQIAGFACLAVALVALGKLGLDEFRAGILDDFLVEAGNKRFEELAIAGEKPRIENCRADRHVFARKPDALIDVARGMADFQSHVPQHVEHVFDNLLAPGGLLVGQQKQKIDI